MTGASTVSSNPSGPVCPLSSRPSVTTTITHPASVSQAQVRRASPSNGLPHRTRLAGSPPPPLGPPPPPRMAVPPPPRLHHHAPPGPVIPESWPATCVSDFADTGGVGSQAS